MSDKMSHMFESELKSESKSELKVASRVVCVRGNGEREKEKATTPVH